MELIKRQFALRRLSAAKKMEMEPAAAIAKVKHPQSTTVKVAGLTNSQRESHLKLLADALKQNVEVCSALAKTDHELVYKDFEDIAKELEYDAFTNNTVMTMYRRAVMKHFATLKDCIKKTQLYGTLKSHVPKKREAHGGEFQSVAEMVRQQYGDDIIKEFEESQRKEEPKKEKRETNKSGNFSKETSSQTKIQQFFQKKIETKVELVAEANVEPKVEPKVEPDVEPEVETKTENGDTFEMSCDEDEDVIVKEKIIETVDLSKTPTKRRASTTLKQKNSCLFGGSSDDEEIPILGKKRKIETVAPKTQVSSSKGKRVAHNLKPKFDKNQWMSKSDDSTDEDEAAKIEQKIKDCSVMSLLERLQEENKKKLEEEQAQKELAAKRQQQKEQEEERRMQEKKKQEERERRAAEEKRRREKAKQEQEAQLRKERNEKKAKVSDLVIKLLMPFYKAKAIVSKELFKSTARAVTHKFQDSDYGKREVKIKENASSMNFFPFTDESAIKDFITNLFKDRKIRSEDDLKF